MTHTFHLGLDAGNTKTDALVVDSEGRILGTGQRGCGDIYGALTPQHAVEAVVGAVTDCLTSAGVSAAALNSATFCIAGVDWPEDASFWRAALQAALPAQVRVTVRNDGFAPLRCVYPCGSGVAILAGTGPAVAGRGSTGSEWALGWWVLDPLGAGGLGDRALDAVYRAELGIGHPTALTPLLLDVFEYPDVETLRHEFTRREHPRRWQDKALAARAVLHAASHNDPIALQITDAQAQALAGYARACALRVGFAPDTEAVPVVLAGSVLTAPRSPLTAMLLTALRHHLPEATPVLAPLPPVAGAALDAIADAGLPVTPQTVHAVGGSLRTAIRTPPLVPDSR